MNEQDFQDGPISTNWSTGPATTDAVPATEYPEPQEGGSYTRNPNTGALDLIHRAGLDAEKE